MCDQRERLIGYVYGEGDEGDLGEVQRHLDACPECRAEVAGLRSVRADLLAWDVPAHQSVWRPFVAAPVTPWWRQVPAWAMAAAASVMLIFGAAGSVVVHAFMPDQTVTRQSDVAAVEQNLLARMRDEISAVDARLERVSSRSQALSGVEGDHQTLASELVELRAQNKELAGVIKSIWANRDQDRKAMEFKDGWLEQKIKNVEALVQAQVR